MWKYVNPGYGELLDEKLGTTKSTVYNPKNGVCIGGQNSYGTINISNLKEVYIKCDVYFKESSNNYDFNIYATKDNIKIGIRVKIPFGKMELEGFVMNILNDTDYDKNKIKDIESRGRYTH